MNSGTGSSRQLSFRSQKKPEQDSSLPPYDRVEPGAMKTAEIDCPSGLKGTIRKWKLSEGNILANKRIAKQNKLIDELMRAVWLKTNERGQCEYEMNGIGPKWGSVLAGDRMYALLQARILTFGPQYDFKHQCDSPGCERHFWWEIDLNDLKVKKLKPEHAKIFNAGNRFEAELEAIGKKIQFQLMTGSIQRRALKDAEDNQEEPLTTSLSHRILGVEGEKFDGKKKTIKGWLDDQDLDFAIDIVELLDEYDCGIETAIDIECPHCENEMEVELPLGREFFMPRKRKKKRARTVDSSRD